MLHVFVKNTNVTLARRIHYPVFRGPLTIIVSSSSSVGTCTSITYRKSYQFCTIWQSRAFQLFTMFLIFRKLTTCCPRSATEKLFDVKMQFFLHSIIILDKHNYPFDTYWNLITLIDLKRNKDWQYFLNCSLSNECAARFSCIVSIFALGRLQVSVLGARSFSFFRSSSSSVKALLYWRQGIALTGTSCFLTLPGPRKYGFARVQTLLCFCRYSGIPLLCVTCTHPSGKTSKWLCPISVNNSKI